MTDKVVIAAIGTMIVILSVLITGPYISALQTKISKLENVIFDAEKELAAAAEAIQHSYLRYLPAEIKLVILNTNPSVQDRRPIQAEAFKAVVHGILERYIAAEGVGASQERFKEIERVAARAAQGDQLAANELTGISESLLIKWASRHQAIAEKKAADKRRLEALKVRVSNWRNIAIVLQVLGLITVLLKDVASMSS